METPFSDVLVPLDGSQAAERALVPALELIPSVGLCWSSGPHVAEEHTLASRIVACVDGSDESERALEPAQRWAATLGLPLWLIEVGDPGADVEGVTKGDPFESAHVARLARELGGVEGWDLLHDKHPAHALVDMAAASPPMLAWTHHIRGENGESR